MGKLSLPLLFFLSGFAYADNITYFCGEGRDSYSVDDTLISLAINDEDATIYFKGQQDPQYEIKKLGDGYSAIPRQQSENNPRAEFLFHSCSDRTQVEMGSSMVPATLIDCNCEQD